MNEHYATAGAQEQFWTGHYYLPRRFMEKVKVHEPTGCWLWMGRCQEDGGHGQYRAGKKVVLAHRYAYEKVIGPIPEGQVLRHVRCRCANCVNPWHTRPGTHQDNVRDRMRDGTTARGEQNGRAKLDTVAVLDIRRNPDQMTQADLARKYGVTPRAVRFVQQGVNWAHVTA